MTDARMFVDITISHITMYECATCDRVFRYREDVETHKATCGMNRTRRFAFGKRGGLTQMTIVEHTTHPDIATVLSQVLTEMSAMRAEITVLTAEVARLKRNDAARGKRNTVADMHARQPADTFFGDWITNTVATTTHLHKLIDYELVDGLESLLYDALPVAPVVAVPGTKPVLYAYMDGGGDGGGEWRKLADADYETVRTEFTRKLLALFDVWQKTNAHLIETNETENQRNIACMSKIYGARGPALTHRAADFRRRVQKIALELHPV